MGVSVWQRRAGKLSLGSSVKKHSLHGYSHGFIYCECTSLFPSTSNSPPTTGSTAHNCARASLWPHSQDCLLQKEQSHTSLTCQETLTMMLAKKIFGWQTCVIFICSKIAHKSSEMIHFQGKMDQIIITIYHASVCICSFVCITFS